MSRCLSSSVILPPSNPSWPITPPLPCHPVPMLTAVRRALRFRPRLCHLRRGSHSLRSLPRSTSTVGQIRHTEGSFVSPFLWRFFGFIYILFSFYTPLISFFQLRPFLFTIRHCVPAFVWFKWIERQSLPPFQPKKSTSPSELEPSTARTSSALYRLSHSFRIAHSLRILPPTFHMGLLLLHYLPTYLLSTLRCICATPYAQSATLHRGLFLSPQILLVSSTPLFPPPRFEFFLFCYKKKTFFYLVD